MSEWQESGRSQASSLRRHLVPSPYPHNCLAFLKELLNIIENCKLQSEECKVYVYYNLCIILWINLICKQKLREGLCRNVLFLSIPSQPFEPDRLLAFMPKSLPASTRCIAILTSSLHGSKSLLSILIFSAFWIYFHFNG